MKFIHTSNLHLGAEPETGKPWAEARQNEIWTTVKNLVNICNEEEIDLLLITGDLFNKQPLVKELKALNSIFVGLKKTRVYFIAGNHDYVSARSRYRDFKWCDKVTMIDSREMSEVYIYDLDTTLYGFSYHDSEITSALYRDVHPKISSGIHILMAHGGDSNHVPIDYEKLKGAGFDYVALGHERNMHKYAENMYQAGSPEPVDRDETGEHGYISGEFIYEKGSYTLTTKFVPIAIRKYINLHVRVDGDDTNSSLQNYITGQLLKYGAGNMYHIFLEGVRNENVVFDAEQLSSRGMITEVTDNTVLDYNYDELRSANRENVIGAFMSKLADSNVDESIRNRAMFYGIDALLKATEEKKQ